MSVVGWAVQLKNISNLTPSTGNFCLPFFCMADFHHICDTVSFFSSSYVPSPWLHQLSGEELLPLLPVLVTATAPAQQTGQPLAAPPQHGSHVCASTPSLQGLCHDQGTTRRMYFTHMPMYLDWSFGEDIPHFFFLIW